MDAERAVPVETKVAPKSRSLTAAAPVRRRAMTRALAAPPIGLEVGAADHPLEREADRLADGVLQRLAENRDSTPHDHVGADGSNVAGRVRRSAAGSSVIGAAGGSLDAGTSDAIERERGGGAALSPDVRREMEGGFGADFGRVRLHTGARATQLNESMQAQAFTVGNDVFLHDAAPSTDTPGGQHLLAHELAHTLQQSGGRDGGGASRQIHRRLWDSKTFMKATSQGALVRTSSRQTAIKALLDDYHAAYPTSMFMSSAPPTASQLAAAEQRVAEMREVAKRWIDEHTMTTTSGETVTDGSRTGRRTGMDNFIAQCDGELLMIRQLGELSTTGKLTATHDVSNVVITNPSEKFSKVAATETGDVTSAFRRLGVLIDAAAPLDGDAASIKIEVKIPIPPGYVGFEIGASVSRDGGKVSVSANAGVTGGATVDVASIGGALGGYLKADAKTGADAAELMSYGLFRRSRQSNLIPREVENFLWGGANSGAFGWAKAEEWSLGVEKRILSEDGASVESGAYGSANAKIKLSAIADLTVGAKGTIGTKIDKDTLTTRKGGAGKANLKSGAAPDSGKYDKSSSRGMQKSVGVGTSGLEFEVAGKIGPLSGATKVALGWSSDGKHGKKTITFDTFKLSGGFGFEMPMGQMLAGGVGNWIPELVSTYNKIIRTATAEAHAREGARAVGNGVDQAANMAGTIAGLANVPATSWAPFGAPAAATAGLGISGTTKFTLTAEFDFMKSEFSVTINQSKGGSLAETVLDTAGNATDVFKLELERTSRLLKLTYKGGKWTPS